jgi:hypothetical protein
MNGRVYDPLLGRFGTPDPVTESPYSTQGWNRYAYVGNAPLNFTDPSGFCFAGCFWQAPFKALGGALRRTPILGNILQVAGAALCAPLGPICAGLVSATITGLASGDIGQALKAGFISAVTAGAFQVAGDLTGGFTGALGGGHGPLEFLSEAHVFNIASHAAVGCGSAAASGGECGAGALSGAVGSFAGPLSTGLSSEGRLVVATVSGGLASIAGGGKFGNGAVTAAFGYLYNELGNNYERGYPHGEGWGASTHYYYENSLLCSTSECTLEAASITLRKYPAPSGCVITPFCNPSEVFTGDRTYAFPVGTVEHTVYTSLVINQTLPGHLLHDGTVLRSVYHPMGIYTYARLGLVVAHWLDRTEHYHLHFGVMLTQDLKIMCHESNNYYAAEYT